jgi:quinol monooxygenase YgiN
MAVFVAAIRTRDHPSKGVADRHKGEPSERQRRTTLSLRSSSKHFEHNSSYIELYLSIKGAITMGQYAINKSVGEAVNGGGLLVVAQWEAKEGQAERIADILARFLPEAQSEPGAKLFLISRAKENPAQFLFYELFRDEAAFKAHQESAHFKTFIAGQALPLLAKRERAQYSLL